MSGYNGISINNDVPSSKRNKMLKVDKRLPQIIVPREKAKILIEWWNTDIRFESSIPHSFEEGYLVIEDLFHIEDEVREDDEKIYSELIKLIAKSHHITYRVAETTFIDFIRHIQNVVLYFSFIDENKMYAEAYNMKNEIVYGTEFALGKTDEPATEVDVSHFFNAGDIAQISNEGERVDDYISKKLCYIHLSILATCLWYIATSGNHTKYIYENKTPVISSRSKHTVQVSNTKFISTPIYDIGKTKTINVDRLVTRKKGWTYSHSFEVHGHYRHYKNGKVIFIKPFVKGENKDFKAQKVILNPKD